MNEWEWQLLEDKSALETIQVRGSTVRRGDKVRLIPHAGGDIFDLALKGKVATIESLEQDYEGNVHVCVVIEDDPGKDIGLMRQPGHRFFFSAEEVEPMEESEITKRAVALDKKILVACIGNIFLGDDGFGVEVARELAKLPRRNGVRVADFGIRGFDLAYALMEGYETTILVDAYAGQGIPGTLTVLEPDLSVLTQTDGATGFVEPHAMNPVNVLRMAMNMGAQLRRVLLVGCVPGTLGPEEGQMGLSEPVSAAVPEAASLIESLIGQILNGENAGAA